MTRAINLAWSSLPSWRRSSTTWSTLTQSVLLTNYFSASTHLRFPLRIMMTLLNFRSRLTPSFSPCFRISFVCSMPLACTRLRILISTCCLTHPVRTSTSLLDSLSSHCSPTIRLHANTTREFLALSKSSRVMMKSTPFWIYLTIQ